MRGLQSLNDKLPTPQPQSKPQSKPQSQPQSQPQRKPHIFAQPDEFILTGDREHGWVLWNQQKIICKLPTINHLNNVISQYLNFGAKIIYLDEKYQRFDVILNQNEEVVRRRQRQAS